MSHVGHERQAKPGAAAAASGGTGPLYSPADTRGNFAPLLIEDPSAADVAGTFDLEELEHDASERKPGGPVAEAIIALPAPVKAQKWLLPFVGFLLASLFQSMGVFKATCAYAEWMISLEDRFNNSKIQFVLPDAYTGDRRLHSLGRNLQGSSEQLGGLQSQVESNAQRNYKVEGSSSVDSSFSISGSSSSPLESSLASSSSFGSSSGSSSSSGSLDFTWLLPAPQNMISGGLAIVWFFVVTKTKNLRLWTQTMLVGIVLSLLKGLLLFTTVLPDPSGWDDCKEGLDSNILNTAKNSAPIISTLFSGFVDIVEIWMLAPRNLVCSDGILSRSSYIASLFAFGLYDLGRISTRKLKPHFRWLYRLLFGTMLAGLVLWSGKTDVENHHQYTVDVVLAIVFTLLVYGSPLVALGVDKWLTLASGQLSVPGGHKDSYDEGDVIVPICCFPFCCLHGRFFLYSATAREAESEIKTREEQERKTTNHFRNMAASKAEEFRLTQEVAARRLLELEALIEAEQQRSEARERDDEQEAKTILDAAVAEAKGQFVIRTAKAAEELKQKLLERREAIVKLQDQESSLSSMPAETEAKRAEELDVLQSKIEIASTNVADKRQELVLLEETLARYREDAKELGIFGT